MQRGRVPDFSRAHVSVLQLLDQLQLPTIVICIAFGLFCRTIIRFNWRVQSENGGKWINCIPTVGDRIGTSDLLAYKKFASLGTVVFAFRGSEWSRHRGDIFG